MYISGVYIHKCVQRVFKITGLSGVFLGICSATVHFYAWIFVSVHCNCS